MMDNKAPYLGSVVLIMISCLLFILLNLLSVNMLAMTSSFIEDYVQEDANFVANTKLNNIRELETKFNVRIEAGGVFDYALTEGKTLRIFSENTKINIPAIIEGQQVQNGGILIDPSFAKTNDLQIGEKIKILDHIFTISGYASLPNYIYILRSENDILNDPNHFGIAVLSKENFAELQKGNRFYAVKFNNHNVPVGSQSEQFRDYLRGKDIVISQWNDIGQNVRVTYVTTKVEGISRMSTTMPIAILLLTCILVGIVIWRLLQKEAVIIGTLYAQGYRRREILQHYLRYPLFIALSGGMIGTFLGALFLQPMLNFMLAYFNLPLNTLSFDPRYIVASILLPVIFLGLSGMIILCRELRLSPVELLRGGRRKDKVTLLERKLNLDRFNFATTFKLRQQLRSLSRLIFLLFGVIMATMLLLLGFTAKSSIDYLLQDNLTNTFKFQYEYVYNALHQEQVPLHTEPFSAASFTLDSDSALAFRVCGIRPDSAYIVLKDKSGKPLSAQKTVITRPLADKLQVSPGDTVNVINKLDARAYSVMVDDIAETYIGEYIFMPISEFNQMLSLPANSYMGLWSKEKLAIPDNELYSSRSIDDTVKAFEASLAPLESTIGVIALMAFMIGLIVIYVVTSLVIEENKETISLLKIFGYRKKEVNSLILNSSSGIIVIGYLLGIPLILASMSMMFKSLTESVNLAMPVTISYPYIIVGFIIIYLTYTLAKALSRRKINQISMGEALQSARD